MSNRSRGNSELNSRTNCAISSCVRMECAKGKRMSRLTLPIDNSDLHDRGWVMPAVLGSNPLGLLGAPRIFVVLVNGRVFVQKRVDDPPSFFDVILTGKQCAIAFHCRSQQ